MRFLLAAAMATALATPVLAQESTGGSKEVVAKRGSKVLLLADGKYNATRRIFADPRLRRGLVDRLHGPRSDSRHDRQEKGALGISKLLT